MKDEYDLCVDAYVDDEMFDPAMLPRPVDLATVPSEELAVAWRRQWQAGQELRIRFLDGDAALHRRVRTHAETWLSYANIRFAFGNHVEAEIRITFTGSGNRSLVGKDALGARPNAPTMWLGGVRPDSDEVRVRRTVLHEFGHALGCIHEQASPAAAIPWDEPRVYEFFRQWQGWSDERIRRNVLHRYSADQVRFTCHDPNSIMQYPVPAILTRGRVEIGWNTDLSEGDKSFIARMYPRRR